jgi:hypothetical protein
MSVMKRWRVEELYEVHDLIEHGPDWREIDEIVMTLNRPALNLVPEPLPVRQRA